MKKWMSILSFILLLKIGLLISITGFSVFDSEGPTVSREILETENGTSVKLIIESDENVLAIREIGTPDSVVSYSLSDEKFEISEFKSSENTWVFADRNKSIDLEIDYNIFNSTDFTDGDFLYFEGEELVSKSIEGDSFKCNNLICVPSIVEAGKPMRISLNPSSSNKISSYAYIYRNNLLYKASLRLCNSSYCLSKSIIEYALPNDWVNGDYVLKIYDYSEKDYSKRWKEFNFTYYGGSEPRNTEVIPVSTNLTTGDKLILNINAGPEGISLYAPISRDGTSFYDYVYLSCIDPSCKNENITLEYQIPSALPKGNYKARIYDNNILDYSKRYIDVPFTISGQEFKKLSYNLSQGKVGPGDKIKLTVSPGSYGIYSTIALYDHWGRYYYGFNPNCTNYRCYDPISVEYTLPDYLVPGKYYFYVYDLSSSNQMRMYFEVVNGSSPRELNVTFPFWDRVFIGGTIRANVSASRPGGISPYLIYAKYKDKNAKTLDYNYYKYININDDENYYYYFGDKEVDLQIPSNWPAGSYTVRVYDYSETDYTKRTKYFDFEVLSSGKD